jgi:ABC-type amino acid transport substrate-binding protein
LNTELKTGNLKVHIVIVPMSRDQLYRSLASGKVDMVAAMVTVRPELEKHVAFSEPTRTNVSQVVVTDPELRRSRRSTIWPVARCSSEKGAPITRLSPA